MRDKTRYPYKPRGSVIAALDVGSSKIACFIARVVDDAGHFEVLGIGHQAAQGVRGGTITDLAAAEAAIRRSVHAAESMAAAYLNGYPLRDVVVNVPALHSASRHITVDVHISGHEITESDVCRALARAQDQIMTPEHEVLHLIPTAYAIDGQGGIREPRGMVGQKLNVDIHVLTGESGPLRNMATPIERAHLDITALCAAPYAAGLSALVEDEMDLGCTVIDMGGGVTSLAVFQSGEMIFSGAVPMGGNHVTNDIARILTTPLASAERLKTLYGSALASLTDEGELIDVPQMGEQAHAVPNHVPRALLIGIIQPRLEEIFDNVRACLKDSGLDPGAGRRVVLTGGASQLPGIRDLAQHVLDRQVRLGRPIRPEGLPDAVSGPAFATTAGLLVYVCERPHELPGQIMAAAPQGSLWESVRTWLRENW